MVEYHAQTASINVDKGTDELEQAKNLKIKATKVCKENWGSVRLQIQLCILEFRDVTEVIANSVVMLKGERLDIWDVQKSHNSKCPNARTFTSRYFADESQRFQLWSPFISENWNVFQKKNRLVWLRYFKQWLWLYAKRIQNLPLK